MATGDDATPAVPSAMALGQRAAQAAGVVDGAAAIVERLAGALLALGRVFAVAAGAAGVVAALLWARAGGWGVVACTVVVTAAAVACWLLPARMTARVAGVLRDLATQVRTAPERAREVVDQIQSGVGGITPRRALSGVWQLRRLRSLQGIVEGMGVADAASLAGAPGRAAGCVVAGAFLGVVLFALAVTGLAAAVF